MDEDVDRLGDSRHGSIGNSMDAADALRDALEDAGNGDDDDQEEDNDEDLDHDNTDQGVRCALLALAIFEMWFIITIVTDAAGG